MIFFVLMSDFNLQIQEKDVTLKNAHFDNDSSSEIKSLSSTGLLIPDLYVLSVYGLFYCIQQPILLSILLCIKPF